MTEEVWQAAYAALKDATRVCIIGFSMPETDPHFKHLIGAALSDNPGLYSMTVVDYHASDALQARYQDFFAPLAGYGRFRFYNNGLEEFLYSGPVRELGRGIGVRTVGRI
jgi:hypothetical protein